MKLLVLMGGLMAAAPRPLLAQRLPPATYASWEPTLPGFSRAPAGGFLPTAPDYRWEGILIGGTAGFAFGGYLGFEFCHWSDSPRRHCTLAAIEGALVTGVLGAGMGGLIGGLFPKPPPERP